MNRARDVANRRAALAAQAESYRRILNATAKGVWGMRRHVQLQTRLAERERAWPGAGTSERLKLQRVTRELAMQEGLFYKTQSGYKRALEEHIKFLDRISDTYSDNEWVYEAIDALHGELADIEQWALDPLWDTPITEGDVDDLERTVDTDVPPDAPEQGQG